ncbi:MAG: U32 family peptidase [Clostridiaceae bacterium]|nr:U32 family peptidase [Clostridiaceae bacterium]
MDNKKIELLAPAGSFESLKAAIHNGADAVYLGGGKFNARINADNFSEEDLARAIDYAHECGVKIYITLNTLLKNEELDQALRFAHYVYQQGADAVIIQDIGLLKLLNKYLPDLEIHASTQMTTVDGKTVSELANLGVKRVVLARELSYDEIQKISSDCKIELEIFIHGALCVCYSGQCLISSFIGGRSGNRGLCAQPCRLPYALWQGGDKYSEPSYFLSTRDLSAIDYLPQLKAANIASLKLEGRMKSPEYVAVVTQVYRKYIDLLEQHDENEYRVDDADRRKLLQAFNRGSFTNSYLENNRDPASFMYTKYQKNQGILIGKVVDVNPPYVRIALEEDINMGDGIEIHDAKNLPKSFIVTDIMLDNKHTRVASSRTSPWVGDIKGFVQKGSKVYRTMSKALFSEARSTFESGGKALVPLNMHITLKTGQKTVLMATDSDGNRVCSKSNIIAEKAIKQPLGEDRLKDQLSKTGNTPYYLNTLVVDTDHESVIPISAVNELRRNVIEQMKEIRISKTKRNDEFRNIEFIDKEEYKSFPNGQGLDFTEKDKNTLELSAYFYEFPESLENLNKIVTRVYIPIFNCGGLVKLREQFDGEIFLWTYPVLKDSELNEAINIASKVSEYWDGMTYSSLGELSLLKNCFPNKKLCADYSMNIFNNQALRLNNELGAGTAVLSPELTLNEIKNCFCPDLKLEAIVYGRVPLMTMENCPHAAEKGCRSLCDKCRHEGYLKDRKGEIFPYVRNPLLGRTQIFNSHTLFMDDTQSLKETNLSLLRLIFTKEDMDYAGDIADYYYNKIKNRKPLNTGIIDRIKKNGHTKGHWFRGV